MHVVQSLPLLDIGSLWRTEVGEVCILFSPSLCWTLARCEERRWVRYVSCSVPPSVGHWRAVENGGG